MSDLLLELNLPRTCPTCSSNVSAVMQDSDKIVVVSYECGCTIKYATYYDYREVLVDCK